MTDWHFWKCSGADTSSQASNVRGSTSLCYIHAISDLPCKACGRMHSVDQTPCSAYPRIAKDQSLLGYAYQHHHLALDFPP